MRSVLATLLAVFFSLSLVSPGRSVAQTPTPAGKTPSAAATKKKSSAAKKTTTATTTKKRHKQPSPRVRRESRQLRPKAGFQTGEGVGEGGESVDGTGKRLPILRIGIGACS